MCIPDKGKDKYQQQENFRKAAYKLYAVLKTKKITSVTISDIKKNIQNSISFAEGLALSNYQFLKYFKNAKEKESKLQEIFIQLPKSADSSIEKLNAVIEAVYTARNLVNEPSNFLTATQLAKEAKEFCVSAGCRVEIFEKKRIEALKMGGLLAVNKGSVDPPTFTTIEWKPAKSKNKKPIILVGKGLVFDTGGLSLKSTAGMDAMKSDMGGAAAVIGTMYAVAKAKLPVHIIGLIPSTDNRPGVNAYAPQDVIKMHNGLMVEVLNTDAEGRLILADALSYAKQFNPELVIDLATLTGAATVATGQHGIVAMGTASDKFFDALDKSGYNVYERIVRFPLWDEYKEYIKSDIADIKNVGNREAGAITAGKFLECFTKYPWIHLDIAGSAYLDYQTHYRGKAGSGIGVRLLFDFFRNYTVGKFNSKYF
ncbi:MAG: peptidase M17 [Bacteroidetes bacterium RIFOXYA12_FULL_35_11]|nr:MAG: peptidase M17 [Bacteroidetes bacterium GWF2_35_48]OFY75504.1 MAG: peptidase M17 [Bacteroidetes bacterium RIFOXYA12_FULL_35_11]HBX52847.1 peptidase M17 [Bacteroidales bacterium]